MWIKDKFGDYINADQVISIYEKSDSTFLKYANYTLELTDGDYRDEIILNIISGTKLMEV